MPTKRAGGKRDLLVVAGEASGDAHAARVLAQLRRARPDLRPFGLGGPALLAAGLESVGDGRVLNLVGLSEAVRALPQVLRLRDAILSQVQRRRAGAALLVDLPGFNLHLAKYLKKLDVPVIYYIAPQAWAWREGRVRKIRRRVDQLCVIFPFEAPFFGDRAVPTEFVGHPLLEDEPQPVAPAEPPRVAIVPGSRPREIARLLPALAGAARLLAADRPDLRFCLPLAPGVDAARVEEVLSSEGIAAELVHGGAMAALRGARLGLVTSGTATLEGALAGVPMVVVYRVSRSSYLMVRPFVQVEHVCIVNILAGRRLVPELLQGAVRPARIAEAGRALLDDGPARQAVLEGLAEVVAGLGGPRPSERVAWHLARALAGEDGDG